MADELIPILKFIAKLSTVICMHDIMQHCTLIEQECGY